MPKALVITALVTLLLVACSDNTTITTEPSGLNELPRASDGVSPTDYINMHNLSLHDQENRLENFNPQDTIFTADYMVGDEECEGRKLTVTLTDSMGNKSTTSYCYSELCGHYLIIYGPASLSGLITYEGCPEMLPDGATSVVRNLSSYSVLNTSLNSLR